MMDIPLSLDSVSNLKSAIGKAPHLQMYCPGCQSAGTILTLPETTGSGRLSTPNMTWAISLFCQQCTIQWNVCIHCHNVRGH